MKYNLIAFALLGIILPPSSIFAKDIEGDVSSMEVVPDRFASIYSTQSSQIAGDKSSQLYSDKRRWENGRTLRVCYFHGNETITRLIRAVAGEWNGLSGVIFDFGPEGTWRNCLAPKIGFPEIRIGFNGRGHWSLVGSDSERYGGELAPSMNFDGFNSRYSETKYSTGNVVAEARAIDKVTILHEFGHALGLLHEHQNPLLDCYSEIKWSGSESVYEYFSMWTKEEVDRNLGFVRETDPDYISGEPDTKSVMLYNLPSSIFKEGAQSKCANHVNYELSDKDRLIVAKIYPKSDSGQIIQSAQEEIEAAYIKSIPQFLLERDSGEYMQRTIVDLESNDTATRRNARARLTQILTENAAPEEIDKMILNLPDGSYRYKLGFSYALGKAGKKIELSQDAINTLSSLESKEKDKTLKGQLDAARINVLVK